MYIIILKIILMLQCEARLVASYRYMYTRCILFGRYMYCTRRASAYLFTARCCVSCHLQQIASESLSTAATSQRRSGLEMTGPGALIPCESYTSLQSTVAPLGLPTPADPPGIALALQGMACSATGWTALHAAAAAVPAAFCLGSG